MQNDLISRSALLNEYRDFKDMDCPSGHTVTADYMIELVEDAPAVDAVEVVRCKDCKFSIPVYQKNGSALEGTLHCLHGRGYQMNAPDREYSFISPNNFCGSGRRKIDAEVHDDA